jgi:hypothetical protein
MFTTTRAHNWTLAVLGVAVFAAPVLAADASKSVAGRWDITIMEGDHQAASWIGIKSVDGKLEAEFLGTGGGVHRIDPPTFENGTLKFKAGGGEFTGKLDGDTLKGTFKKGDGEQKWVAHRYIPKIDVNGRWNLKVGDKEASLRLTQKDSQITGKWIEGRKRTDITNAQLAGYTLTFTTGETMHAFNVKGDVMEGKTKGGDITGTRQRKWGKPVALLEGKPEDLKNWEPLFSKDLNWKIEDGVMTNGHNHTENIVSKRKDFRDFKLHVEFKVPKDGNSGVYLRGRHEIQVADSFEHQLEGGACGALYSRIVPKVNVCKKPGEWQTFDITLIDGYVTVVQNGQAIIDNQEVEGITGGAIDSHEAEPGPIYLQGDHTQVWYRQVILTPAE